ncbi:pyridoxal phosphate-dependent aminotransferase family protein [Bermanella marisrubri]|uniref:8-amino-7-oxononanoate synthase n=1 Tax=Bermanella marisrubri TaxID=207949 RepID=Q1MY49_9GAMM|nr:pyridoxal phosphate-dependent aminotransferase family protein [Bermanella marisrubri]EAT10911.1 8-amino-7-oxononanoate synthase [Oceanobacter sp. RED65] [Bermanella marisrubri]QIZ85322.1 pyridoxal phosphate-dependent aminotransferase family protein [Bermanella marisrubri]
MEELATENSVQESLANRYKLINNKTSNDPFQKAYDFDSIDLMRQANCYAYYQTIDQNEGPEAIVNGKTCTMLGSNNYLGLTIEPRVRQAAIDAIAQFGTSLTGSRLLNGTHALHEKLEEELAKFLNKEAALVFTTGYQANIGITTALVGKNDYLILDKFNHASITDGADLAKGKTVYYQHNDMNDLERVLQSIPEEHGKVIMVDGVFSMEGDLADLPNINRLAKKYSARLVVDDAHGVGVIGEAGRGTANYFGLEDDVDLIAGTFSKALASIGGFVAGDRKVIESIKHFGRSILFSASLPPASVAAALESLRIMQQEPQRVDRLNKNAQYMREQLRTRGFNIGHTETPIIPIIVGEDIKALTLWRELLKEGVYVNAVIYPAVARNQALLRTSYTSEHSREQLDRALEILQKMKNSYQF